jgi:hypothetical protein
MVPRWVSSEVDRIGSAFCSADLHLGMHAASRHNGLETQVTMTSLLLVISVFFLGSTVGEFIYFILIFRVYYRQCDDKSSLAFIAKFG